MADVGESLLLKLFGKEMSIVAGKVKSSIQNYVKMTHKYQPVSLTLQKRDGREAWFKVDGIPEEVLEEATVKAQAHLLPDHRFDFRIEHIQGATASGSEDVQSKAQHLFTHWAEDTQRQFDDKTRGYESEIARLQKETQLLAKEKDNLFQVIRQEKDRSTKLQESYDQASALLEKMSVQSVRPPLEAAKMWVGDWSVNAKRIEDQLSEIGFSGDMAEVKELIDFDMSALKTSLGKEVGTDSVPADLQGIEALASTGTWEETEEYQSLIVEYERARTEIDYIQSVRDGKVSVPESLREAFISTVNVENNRKVMFDYESKETAYRSRTSLSATISGHLSRYKLAEAVRQMKEDLEIEKPLPSVVTCGKIEDKWAIELLCPSSEGVTSKALHDCFSQASNEEGLKKVSESQEENLIRLSLTLPGNIQSCKDASRKQEGFAILFTRRFRESGLCALGLRLSLVKIMEVPDE